MDDPCRDARAGGRRPVHARRVVLLALVLLLAALPTTAAGQPATPVGANALLQFTPVLPTVPSPPRWFTGADGRVHLVYELLLTNAFPVPVTITAVDARDAATGHPIATLQGTALAAAMSLLATPASPATMLPPSTIGVVWFDLPLPGPAALPAALTHQITAAIPPGLPVPSTVTVTGGAATVDRRPPVVRGPALAGAGWLALGSCCDGPHRRSFQPLAGRLYLAQRFAIDFNRLDTQNRLSLGDLALNRSYPSFGQPVLAVADATVVAAVDRFPDQIPNHPTDVTLASADGNHVVLDLGDGRYAFYAHLEAGSVRVHVGEPVRRGQVLGLLGNSGSSSGPHLHFQVMDGPSPLAADGLPYVFDRFALTGVAPPLAQVIALGEAQRPIPIDAADAGVRQDALPLGRDVVDFGDAAMGG